MVKKEVNTNYIIIIAIAMLIYFSHVKQQDNYLQGSITRSIEISLPDNQPTISSNGLLHTTYIHQGVGLKYTILDKFTNSVVSLLTVQSGNVVDSDMAIDSDNNVHIVYFTPTSTDATYVKYINNPTPGGSPLVENIDLDPISTPLLGVSIDIDDNDAPHIATYTTNSITYTKKTAVGWSTPIEISNYTIPPFFANQNSLVSISIDSDDDVFIAYLLNQILYNIPTPYSGYTYSVIEISKINQTGISHGLADFVFIPNFANLNKVFLDLDSEGNPHTVQVVYPNNVFRYSYPGITYYDLLGFNSLNIYNQLFFAQEYISSYSDIAAIGNNPTPDIYAPVTSGGPFQVYPFFLFGYIKLYHTQDFGSTWDSEVLINVSNSSIGPVSINNLKFNNNLNIAFVHKYPSGLPINFSSTIIYDALKVVWRDSNMVWNENTVDTVVSSLSNTYKFKDINIEEGL